MPINDFKVGNEISSCRNNLNTDVMYFQVHARHTDCFDRTGTCNCAVAVREGNDILGIQACDGPLTPIRYLRDPNTPDGQADIKQISSNYYKVGVSCSTLTILLVSAVGGIHLFVIPYV